MTTPAYFGAFFTRVDFQVHSPRDSQWSGPHSSIGEREDFAKALVACCRRKRLGAIAITDHHDLCLWSHVRDAARAEQQSDGTPYPQKDQLIVFPGVELTLSVPPCQALLLFDPELAETDLNTFGACSKSFRPITDCQTRR